MKHSSIEIAQRLGIVDPIVDIAPKSAHVSKDGLALVVCSLWVDAEETEAGFLVIATDGKEISYAQVPKELAPSFGWHCGTAEFENGLIFLCRCTRPSEDETRAVYLPREGLIWGEPKPLVISPDLPKQTTSKGFIKQVMPSAKGIGLDGTIAWPVEALTGSAETTVKSVAFFQPDIARGELNWSFWPPQLQAEGLFATLFGRHRKEKELHEFVRPDPDAFPTVQYAAGKADLYHRIPNILSSFYDGKRLFITSDGATEIKKSGDKCAAISEVRSDGSVEHLYLEDFISPARPDSSKKHDYQARFVSGGAKVLFKSRYQSTDPWAGGYALFSLEDKSLTVCSGGESSDYRGPMEIVGEHALYVEFEEATATLELRFEKIAFM